MNYAQQIKRQCNLYLVRC